MNLAVNHSRANQWVTTVVGGQCFNQHAWRYFSHWQLYIFLADILPLYDVSFVWTLVYPWCGYPYIFVYRRTELIAWIDEVHCFAWLSTDERCVDDYWLVRCFHDADYLVMIVINDDAIVDDGMLSSYICWHSNRVACWHLASLRWRWYLTSNRSFWFSTWRACWPVMSPVTMRLRTDVDIIKDFGYATWVIALCSSTTVVERYSQDWLSEKATAFFWRNMKCHSG